MGKKWTDLKNIHPCWQERSALQLVAVKQSTGNNVSGHYFYCYFLLFLLCFELSVSVLVSVDRARLVLIGEKVCCLMFLLSESVLVAVDGARLMWIGEKDILSDVLTV